MNNSSTVRIHNPHSVLAALETRPRDVIEVQVPSRLESKSGDSIGDPGRDAWVRVVQKAKQEGVRVQSASSSPISQSRGGGKSHGPSRGDRDRSKSELGGRVGVAGALIKPRESLSLEELFHGAKDRAQGKGLWLALDSLQDPHNIGAIFRTASFFGVQGIIVTEERSAPLSATAYDVASGGIEHVPFTMQINLQRAFEVAKEMGLWILGTSERAHDDLKKVEADRPWLVVLGNEERGMRRLTEESCDLLCKVPSRGKLDSLNVSVAAGVIMGHLSS